MHAPVGRGRRYFRRRRLRLWRERAFGGTKYAHVMHEAAQWLSDQQIEALAAVVAETTMQEPSEFVQFWNEILVPKFVRYKHVLVGGLALHSDAVFPKLEVRQGDRVLNAGAGFGDTAIMLARRVGPTGHVTAMDCCDAFLEYGRKDAAAEGIGNVDSSRPTSRPVRSRRTTTSCSRASARCSLRTRSRRCATCAGR